MNEERESVVCSCVYFIVFCFALFVCLFLFVSLCLCAFRILSRMKAIFEMK